MERYELVSERKAGLIRHTYSEDVDGRRSLTPSNMFGELLLRNHINYAESALQRDKDLYTTTVEMSFSS